MTAEQIQEAYKKRELQSLTNRRHRVPECAQCQKDWDEPGPWHDASPRCRSGFFEHCSCDSCF